MLSAAMLWSSAQLLGAYNFWPALGVWLFLFITSLLIRQEYISLCRSGLGREKACVKDCADKPAPTVRSRLMRSASLAWVRPWQSLPAKPGILATPLWQKLVFGLLLALIALRLTSQGIEITQQAMPAWDAWIIWAERAKTWFYLGQLAPYVPTETWLSAPSGSYESEAAHYPIMVSLIHLWAALALDRWDEALVNLPWLGAGIALALTLYGALRSSHIPAWLALGGVWMLLSLPILNTQIAIAGYADLWLTLAYSQLIFGLLLWISTRQRAALVLILLGLLSLPFIKHQVWLLLLASSSPLVIWAIFIAIPPRLRTGLGVALSAGIIVFLGINLSDGHLHLPVLGDISLQATQLVLPGLGKVAPDFGSIAEPLLFHLFILDSWHMLWGLGVIAWLVLFARLLIRHEYMLNGRSGLAREKAHAEAFAGKPAPTNNSCSIHAESIMSQKPRDLMLLALNISLFSSLFFFALTYASPRTLPFIIDGTLVNRGLLYLAPLLIFVIIHALGASSRSR